MHVRRRTAGIALAAALAALTTPATAWADRIFSTDGATYAFCLEVAEGADNEWYATLPIGGVQLVTYGGDAADRLRFDGARGSFRDRAGVVAHGPGNVVEAKAGARFAVDGGGTLRLSQRDAVGRHAYRLTLENVAFQAGQSCDEYRPPRLRVR